LETEGHTDNIYSRHSTRTSLDPTPFERALYRWRTFAIVFLLSKDIVTLMYSWMFGTFTDWKEIGKRLH